MAENESKKAAPVAENTKPADDFPLTLDEFCARLSTTDKRVSLIGGFHVHCRVKQMVQAREADFRREYHAFAGLPA